MTSHRLSAAACAALMTLGVILATALPARSAVLDARLRGLQVRAQTGAIALKTDDLLVTVRFAESPDRTLLDAATAAGARFFGPNAELLARGQAPRRDDVLGGRTVFPLRIPLDRVDELAALEGVVRVEATGAPGRRPGLFRTRDLIWADQAWQLEDPDEMLLRGTGVRVADFDTGVDVFHPDYWNADGPVVSWIDVDLSGDYSSGDAVDVNGNATADPGETLAWLDAPGSAAAGLDASLQLTIDHFYQDLNDSGAREFGAAAGFTETDPTFGEPVFRALDDNENGLLDVGEQLQALGSCKVEAVLQTDTTVKTFGVDLLFNEGDLFGHGTNVGSILAGGDVGRRFAGIAPETTLLFGNLDFSSEEESAFEDQLALGMAWSASEGADIMIYEFGGWIWEFLDGSSNIETLMNEYAADGIIQIAASGNLSTGGMHWQKNLGAATGDSVVATLDCDSSGNPVTDVFGNFYWVGDGSPVEITVESPTGQRSVLSGDASTLQVGDYSVFHVQDISPRGTYRMDFQLSVGDPPVAANLHGNWRFILRRGAPAKSAAPLPIQAMVVDNVTTGWFGVSVWLNAVSTNTVTWPATADSAITVAAFNPVSGSYNNFSGRGRRVDGARIIDLTAPGSPTYTAYRNQALGGVAGGYGGFGGTSAALPHAAGAAALLKQWDPTLTNGEMRRLLRGGATADEHTGAVPNDSWGSGKLNVFQSALLDVPVTAPAAGGDVAAAPRLSPNVPNPFNPATTIRYRLPEAGQVRVELLDLRGRRVKTLVQGRQTAGDHAVLWRGTDEGGRAVGSGVYLVRVELNGEEAVRKVTLLR